MKDPALNHQFERTKLISMYSGGTYRGTYEGTYDRGARAWRARDVHTVANERVSATVTATLSVGICVELVLCNCISYKMKCKSNRLTLGKVTVIGNCYRKTSYRLISLIGLTLRLIRIIIKIMKDTTQRLTTLIPTPF